MTKQDFTIFAERRENQRIYISPQLTLATFQYLSTGELHQVRLGLAVCLSNYSQIFKCYSKIGHDQYLLQSLCTFHLSFCTKPLL